MTVLSNNKADENNSDPHLGNARLFGMRQSFGADGAEQASCERRLTNALAESRSDFEHGRCYTSRESLMQAVKAKRAARA
jgi:hypothetical protein